MNTSTKNSSSLLERINSSIKLKTNVMLLTVLLVSCSILIAIVYHSVHIQVKRDTHDNMVNHLKDLKIIMSNHVGDRQKHVNLALNVAHSLFQQHGKIHQSKRTINVVGTNQITNQTKVYTIPRWFINKKPLYEDTEIVDKIKSLTSENVTIFQKIEDGYLRVSTNVLKKDSTRAVGTFIPNSSNVVKTIEKGESYYGRSVVVDDWFLTAYEPLVVNGSIKGILSVGIKEMDYTLLKKVFDEKKYFDKGYPFLVSENGQMMIHPTVEGENVKETNFFGQFKLGKDEINRSEYVWSEGEGKAKKIQYFTYFEPYKSYISTSIYKSDMYG